MAEKQERVGLVLKVVGEKAKEDASPAKKKAEAAAAAPMPPPPVVMPPPEPDPPVLSAALGKQMDDFVNAQPGDRVSLDGGHVLRSSKGFVSRRHGTTETVAHNTPHEAAQHLIATIEQERHAGRLARHTERMEAQDTVAGEHARAREVASKVAEAVAGDTKFRVELEEELSIPRVGIPLHVHFDPRLHPHDRVGKFRETLTKLMAAPHNSVAHLPNGIAVRRSVTGLSVSGGGEARTLDSVNAAAGEALHRHVQQEVGRGGDFRLESARLLEDLGTARAGAVAEQDAGGAFHLDRRMTEVRKERSKRFAEVRLDSHRGRSDASERRYRELHGNVSAKLGAEHVDAAMALARRSGGHAMTGAEIDVKWKKGRS